MKNQLLTGKVSSLFCAMFFLIIFQGCMSYYKVETVNKVSPGEVKEFDSLNKFLILHAGSSSWHLSELEVTDKNFSGNISVVPPERIKSVTHKRIKSKRYKRKNRYIVLDQVHLSLKDSIAPNYHSGDRFNIAFSDIKKAEVYKKNGGKSTVSWVVPPVGSLVVLAGAVLLSGSCPFIYTSDGLNYSLAGEIYVGAVNPTLERDDYMLLPDFKAVNNNYNLKIANELKERQNTNLADLLLISHPKNATVYLDKYGHVQTSTTRQSPIAATSLGENDCLEPLKAKDDKFFHFNESSSRTCVNHIILTFENKLGADTGKLLINARNSLWADYTYGKFTELLGSYYTKWDAKQSTIPKEKQMKRSLDQDIPLSVYLETKKGWEFVDYFPVVGPMATRDLVMAIDLSKSKSKNVRVKLVTGFMFWDLNYAAMDFTANLPVQTTLLKPSSAIDEKGNDVLSTLYKDDDQHLKQWEIGNTVVVKYPFTQQNKSINNDTGQTICLHSKGYYEKLIDSKGKPDWVHLMSLKHPHSLSKLSMKEYEKFTIKAANLTLNH